MHNQAGWLKRIWRSGVVITALGLVMLAAGLITGWMANFNPFAKLFAATGLVSIVFGLVSLLQYTYARRDPKVRKQMMVNDQDERIQLIRARAGQRAYWISSSLAFFVLIWSSFAGDVGLPVLSADALWFSLAAVVVVPFIVYLGWIVYEQSHN